METRKRQKVIIPPDVKCKECGSKNLCGTGKNEWRRNPFSEYPPRVQCQRYKCNDCGAVFVDPKNGGIINNGNGDN